MTHKLSDREAFSEFISESTRSLVDRGDTLTLDNIVEVLELLAANPDERWKGAAPYYCERDEILVAHTEEVMRVLNEDNVEADERILSFIRTLFQMIDTNVDERQGLLMGDHGEKIEQVITQVLAVITLDKMGMENLCCEDASIFDDNVQKELDYLISLVEQEDETTSDQPKRKGLSSTRLSATKHEDIKSKFEPTTRVKSHLLSQLMSYSEELVQIRNTLFDMAEKDENPSLTELSNKLLSVSDNILNDLLKTQMRPVGNLLNKYLRIVRDLSLELNKKVDVEIIGENIELDSNVIDAINEPLTHLVRNSLDHGFETQETRAAKGKSMVGRLLIHAYNESGKVVISVSDDGKGIDIEKVRAKAISNNVITPETARTLSDKEVLELIFHSGLSTSENVNAVSGRGVGMDAVKRKVEEIKGSIDVFSQKGVGTEIAMIFPLTMATLKVALFDIRGVTYAIPSADIASIIGLHCNEENVSVRFDSDHALLYRNDDVIPLIDPTEYLGDLAGDRSLERAYRAGERISIVNFRHRGQEWGLPVDEVKAFIDIVIKPLDKSMNGNEVFSGAAVLGNGELALVINLKKVIQLSRLS
ncbi:chemotaxis protein CheW [Enterovibrio sp. ZSDZ35]|uniref:histidine kinase n=1 Tax=Enterovibrio qingdaonensis TaxID=2899818 RepID=A0ABT5QRL2_9GAMM|nr:ATP-binding protein [Enterovibrio sp. ZSDZ35]MDD1783209.1 chemotaxis protein CheW [Enterovibrio sp. ZSDZ35]